VGVDEKNSCRKEPKRTEKREEVIKDRSSTAVCIGFVKSTRYTMWFKYDRDYLCVNKSQFVPVIFEPPCTLKAIEVEVAVHNIYV
jgi:hypothetical protein